MAARDVDVADALGGWAATASVVRRENVVPVAATAVLAVGWLTFVFGGSQLSYAIAAAGAMSAAYSLGRRRAWASLVLVTAVAVVVGTELNGVLGKGAAWLGSMRLLDLTLLAALCGLAVRHRRDLAFGGVRSAVRRHLVVAVAAVGIGAWLVVPWVLHGALTDPAAKTDVRLAWLGLGSFTLAAAVLPGRGRAFLLAFAALTGAVALKALLIKVTGIWTIGAFDRLQASHLETVQGTRVILVGGDTVLILAPALAIHLARTADGWAQTALVALAPLTAAAVLASGTRTSVVIAAVLVGTVLRSRFAEPGLRPGRWAYLLGAAVVAGLAVTAVSFGLVDRFARGDGPGTGLGFRLAEIQSATRLPAADLIVGQGLGGRFASKDVNGAQTETSWSHVLPIWIVLKVGLIGLAACLALFAWALSALTRRGRSLTRSEIAAVVIVGGLLMMSLTLGRLAQPEGPVLAAVAAVILLRRLP